MSLFGPLSYYCVLSVSKEIGYLLPVCLLSVMGYFHYLLGAKLFHGPWQIVPLT